MAGGCLFDEQGEPWPCRHARHPRYDYVGDEWSPSGSVREHGQPKQTRTQLACILAPGKSSRRCSPGNTAHRGRSHSRRAAGRPRSGVRVRCRVPHTAGHRRHRSQLGPANRRLVRGWRVRPHQRPNAQMPVDGYISLRPRGDGGRRVITLLSRRSGATLSFLGAWVEGRLYGNGPRGRRGGDV